MTQQDGEIKNPKITYGSIISISHLSDEDALIAGDGFTKRSVVLKGMSPYHRQQTKRFTIDQFNQFGIANCLFVICPKMSNGTKGEILKALSTEEEDVQMPQQPEEEKQEEEMESKSISKKDVLYGYLNYQLQEGPAAFLEDNQIRDFQGRLFNEYKYNVENFEKEKTLDVSYDQQVQFLHVASSKWLACHQKEAKFENQNFKLSLDCYSSESTLFRIVPAFKYQKDGDQNIYASEIVRIVRSVPILNKATYLHCSGEIIDVKKSQFFIGLTQNKTGEMKIQKREVNTSLEEATSWKINLYSEYIAEGAKQLKAGDILWLHHSEKNATLAAQRSSKAFDKTRFHSLEMQKWLSQENVHISVNPSLENSFEQYTGNTYSMWIIEQSDYKVGGLVQYDKQYRLKHFSSNLYLSVQRPPPEVKEAPPPKKDPYAINLGSQHVQIKAEYISHKEPPAKIVLTPAPDRSTLFEFKPLKESDLEKRFVEQGAFIYLKNVENRKYIDIISKLDEEGGAQHNKSSTSQHLVQYLKPILRNEKEKSDYAVFKLYRTNTSETLEILFLDSCYKNLLKFLFYISNFHWKNDNSDKELLKILEKKLTTCRAAILELDDFLNNKIYNSTPEQKYGLTNSYRQLMARQQFFIDVLVKILCQCVSKVELEMWQERKSILQEIEEDEKLKRLESSQLQASKKKRMEGLTKKNLIEFVVKKVEICNSVYKVLISLCKDNIENQLYMDELLPYFLMQAKFIPMGVTFIVSLYRSNLALLLKLSENLKIDFDYTTQQEVKEDMNKKIKVLINLYERETTQEQQSSLLPDNNKLIMVKTHEKITQKPLNLINFFFNILWDQNSINNEEYIQFLSYICTYSNQSVQINQENLFKLYKKHNTSKIIMGMSSENTYRELDWDGMLRLSTQHNLFLIPPLCDKKKFKFIINQLFFFSQVSFGRNYIWKKELVYQFPQKFLFQNIWARQDNPKLQELRPLCCKLAQSLYVDHQPLRKVILPNYCRLFKQCDQVKDIDIFAIWTQHNQDFFEAEILDIDHFKKVYKDFIHDITTYLEELKEAMKSHILVQANNKAQGRDILNDELIYNTIELLMLLLSLDIFELVFGKDSSQQYMLLIEPLIYLIQYDRKNIRYLNASLKSIEDEVKKRKEKKDEKKNPMGAMKLPGALSFQSMVNLVKKEEAPPLPDDEEDKENFNQSQNLDDASLFTNPIMRGFIQLNHKLEALTYQEYSKIKTEIEIKLKICSVFDHFLDRRQNFFISNILLFFKHRGLGKEEERKKENEEDDKEGDGNELKMVTLVNDYLIGLVPNIAKTGVKSIDNPEKEVEDPFAFMNLKKLANLKNMFEEKKPEKFTNYFLQFNIEGFWESYDLDQYLSLKANDDDVKDDPIGSALPFLLNTFFFVHDELLEERCLNVTMRIFNQREELRNNLKNLQILFSEEKASLFLYLEKTMVKFTELIERSEIWLSEFNKKTSIDIPEMQHCCLILNNLAMGFYHNLEIKDDSIQLMKEAENKLEIDDQKQRVMNFLKVHQPVIELIKNGFHTLTDVLMDSMFPEEKKKTITELFQNAYKFLIRFCMNNKQNQMILYQEIEIFIQFLQFNVGQIQLIQEIFRDNHKLLTTKVDALFINRILVMIHHEGRQKDFLELYPTIIIIPKHRTRYIFDNQLLILNTFLPMRHLRDLEIKILYADGMKGKSIQFYLEDFIHETTLDLFTHWREVDWKDTYIDEPFLYHRSLLNMLIQTTLIQSDRRQYDPNLSDINNRDNFNISVVKLKKMFQPNTLIELLSQPDDFIDTLLMQPVTSILDIFSEAQKKTVEFQSSQKEKRIGFRILKPQLCEFLRLVHITSEKRPPQNTELVQFQRELQRLIEFEGKKLEKLTEGCAFHLEYVNYLIEYILPLLISFHERILAVHGGGLLTQDTEQVFQQFSNKLALGLEAKLYEPLTTRRQVQIIHRFATYYQNKTFNTILLTGNDQHSEASSKIEGKVEVNKSKMEEKKSDHDNSRDINPRQSVFGNVGNLFSFGKKNQKDDKQYQKLKSYDEEDLMMIEDKWNEFIYQLSESKKFQEEIEKEKQTLADAIINVEKLLKDEFAKDVESKPTIDLVIKKFITFLHYAVKQPQNKDTIITLLKIMRKIIEKEENEQKKIELQNHFDKLGATRMVLLVLSDFSKILNQEMLSNLLLFANTLLQGGNRRVQKTIFDFFVNMQKSEMIFSCFASIIKKQISNIQQRAKEKQFQSGITISESNATKDTEENNENDQSEDTESEEKILNQVLQFLQNCAEGHNTDLQNYLRYQSNSRTNYDLINLIADLLKTYYYEERTQRQFDNMIKCLDTLNELVQGPCLENQVAVAESKFFDIVLDLFPLRKEAESEKNSRAQSLASSGKSGKKTLAQRRKSKFASSDALEPWMPARLQNKVLILVLSLLEMREIKGKNSIIKRIMRNLPINVLERHMCKVFKKFHDIYDVQYLMDAFGHLEVDPRELSSKEREDYPKKYFQCIIQNGFYMFFLICYYFESEETLDSPLVNLHKIFMRSIVRKDADGLFSPNSTLGQLIGLVQTLIEKSYEMAAKVALATLVSLKGHVSEDEINQQKLKQKIEERKRRLKKAFNFYMSNTAHIEVVRNGNLEILFFSLFPYCKCFPKEEKQKFQETVDRGSVKSKVQGLVEASPFFIEIMIHEEYMKRFYQKYPIVGFFANYIQLWKDIAYYLTLLLNLLIIGSFAVHNDEATIDRMQAYVFFRKAEWTHEQTKSLFLILGIIMTCCSLFVVVFFLAKIAPLIIKRAWFQKPIFDGPRPGLIKSLINLLYKLFFVLFSCLADFEVLYYLGYGCFAVIGTLIHPFFFSFHLTVVLIRYPTLKNVIRSITEPKEQLILSLVLLLILTYIYTLVAYLTQQEDYQGNCHSVLYCFLYIFDINGKVPGGIGGNMSQGNPNPVYTPARFIGDSLNNLLNVIIMISIVSGIIIDTFGSLREEENNKNSDIKDKCFMCGNENVVFERKSDGSSGGFQNHIRVNHYMWNYMYFIAYLSWKNPQDYNGIESYIAEKLEKDDLLWLPFNRAMELADENEDESALEKKQISKMNDDLVTFIENTKQIVKAIKHKKN